MVKCGPSGSAVATWAASNMTANSALLRRACIGTSSFAVPALARRVRGALVVRERRDGQAPSGRTQQRCGLARVRLVAPEEVSRIESAGRGPGLTAELNRTDRPMGPAAPPASPTRTAKLLTRSDGVQLPPSGTGGEGEHYEVAYCRGPPWAPPRRPP